MKKILVFVVILTSISLFSQDKAKDQKHRLSQYIGTWLSADSIIDTEVASNPKIRVKVAPRLDGNSLQVDVFEKHGDTWVPILVELISYDITTDQIVASGQNSDSECFVGKGFFDTNNIWSMQDVNHKGELGLNVTFNFISNTEVVLQGIMPNPKDNWEIKYIKNNSKDKNVGIQLVSVKDAMNENPIATLQQLGRMGYSYVETFVYNDGKFYGMEPVDFRELVEANGMKFSGSMTFKSMPESVYWNETMKWWELCIQDHLDAGVEYITTSNNEIKNISTLKQLKEYCDYYNAVGKLCKDKGIIFGFHNHADEFSKVEDETVYDFLLKNTNPEFVSFQIDLYWMRIGGANPIEYINKYPGRFFSWHTKDDAEIGASGKVDFDLLFSYAKQASLKYNVVEIEKYNFDPLVSAEMGYRFLYYSDFVGRY